MCRVHSLGFLFSAGVSEGLSRKDEIFNKLLDLFEEKSLYFRNPSSEGQYIAQVCAYDFNFFPNLTWMKVFRINPKFRILRLTFHKKSASKC